MHRQAELPAAGAELLERAAAAGALYLFLDYDGTLAEFSPTPDTVIPDPWVIRLVETLAGLPGVRVAVITGRRLEHILRLLPVQGVALAGTYGLEIRSPEGVISEPAHLEPVLGSLQSIKNAWLRLLAGKSGFYLEDKTWTLAIHARDAGGEDARRVIHRARALALEVGLPKELHFLGGDRFFEVSPTSTDKGAAVARIYREFPLAGALPIYLGDDDKDEAGFAEVNQLGGISIVVRPRTRHTHAGYALDSPAAVRSWLDRLAQAWRLNHPG